MHNPLNRAARRTVAAASAVAVAATLVVAGTSAAPAGALLGDITEFDLGGGDVRVSDMVVGPDGAMWFTELGADRIGRITTGGSISTFPIDGYGQPHELAVGADGNLWFTYDANVDKIGRATTGGDIDLYDIPTADGYPLGIESASDGALWFVEGSGDRLGRIDPAAADPEASITEYPLPTIGNFPTDIAVGPDGLLWFTEQSTDRIGRFAPTAADPIATLVEFPTPVGSSPFVLTSGPDGALWTVFGATQHVARITTAGLVTDEFDVAAAGAVTEGITTGPDGNLWIVAQGGNTVSSLTTTGTLTVTVLPHPDSHPTMPVAGPDGAIWFTEANRIGRLDLTPDPTTTTTETPTTIATTVPPATAPPTSAAPSTTAPLPIVVLIPAAPAAAVTLTPQFTG